MRIRHLWWLLGTTIPIYAMITVLMPDGFAGVPWMGLVMIVFLCLFLALLGFENSAQWNGIIAFVFWLPMLLIHSMNPGYETLALGEVHRGIMAILLIAACHSILQFGLRSLINRIYPEEAQH